jgi:hypothetical protein
MDATAKAKPMSKDFAVLIDCLMSETTTESRKFLSVLIRRNSESTSTEAPRQNIEKRCLNSCCHRNLVQVTHNTSSYPQLFCSQACESDTVRNMLQVLTLEQCIDIQSSIDATSQR